MLYNVALSFEFVDEIIVYPIQMKAIEQYIPVVQLNDAVVRGSHFIVWMSE